MAIIFSYPKVSASNLNASDRFILSKMNQNGNPTKSVSLGDLANFITTTGTGTGTTNAVVKWVDGPGGLLGDSSIEDTGSQINVPYTLSINNATSNADGIVFPHPAGGASANVNFYFAGAGVGSRFVISRGATGGPEIELESGGNVNINRTGNGNFFVGGEVTFDDYGSGTITGTPTFNLEVDANGNVIETASTVAKNRSLINGLVNNLGSAGSGGYDFMEWVSNITSSTQIPVMKTPRALTLRSLSYAWMGDTALSIGVGEQVAFTIGTIPSGSNPVIGNYTSVLSLFDLTNADDGTYANGVVSGLSQVFNIGDVIGVVGQETGTVTPNNGELSITFEFEIN